MTDCKKFKCSTTSTKMHTIGACWAGYLFQHELHQTRENLQQITNGWVVASNNILPGDVWQRSVQYIHCERVNHCLAVMYLVFNRQRIIHCICSINNLVFLAISSIKLNTKINCWKIDDTQSIRPEKCCPNYPRRFPCCINSIEQPLAQQQQQHLQK